jgi:hypothetical protein
LAKAHEFANLSPKSTGLMLNHQNELCCTDLIKAIRQLF